jgi:hypothetical protein
MCAAKPELGKGKSARVNRPAASEQKRQAPAVATCTGMDCHVAPALVSACGPENGDQLRTQARFLKRSPNGSVTISTSALSIETPFGGTQVGNWRQCRSRQAQASTVTCNCTQVLAPLTLLWPFLAAESQQYARSLLQPSHAAHAYTARSSDPNITAGNSKSQTCSSNGPHRFPLVLVPGVQLQVTLESEGPAGQQAALTVVPCALAGGLLVPDAAAAMQQALADFQGPSVPEASGSGRAEGGDWQYGWGLGQLQSSSQSATATAALSVRAWTRNKSSQAVQPPECLGAGFAVLHPQVPGILKTLLQAQQTDQDGSKQQSGCKVHGVSKASIQERVEQHATPSPGLGARVLAVGSPFGCLAPSHFHNLVMQGVVSHALGVSSSSSTSIPPVMLLDAPALPGMEGGPVLRPMHQQLQPLPADKAPSGDQQGTGFGTLRCPGASTGAAVVMHGLQGQHDLIGVLTLPLSRLRDGVQLPVAVTWPHVYQALCLFNQSCGSGQLHRSALPGISTGANAARSIPLPLGGMTNGTCISQQPSRMQLQSTLSMQPCHGISSSPLWSPSAVQAAQQSVVMVRARNSWATGVVVTPLHILTNAHLLLPSMSHQPAPVLTTQATSSPLSLSPASSNAQSYTSTATYPGSRLSSGGDGISSLQYSNKSRYPQYLGVRISTGAGGARWVRARILHIFTTHLDLAVLEVVQPQQEVAGRGAQHQSLHLTPLTLRVADSQPMGFDPVQPPGLISAPVVATAGPSGMAAEQIQRGSHAQQGLQVGEEILVIGHGLFGPHVAWAAAPGITYGSVARVVGSGPNGDPCMLITTAAVRSGASGGAVIDTQGHLVGLVTSNARYVARHLLLFATEGSLPVTPYNSLPAVCFSSIAMVGRRH